MGSELRTRTTRLGNLVRKAVNATDERWKEIEVSGIAFDSRLVKPGDLFVAIPGLTVDGHRFIGAAAEAGAVAALVEHITDAPIKQIKLNNCRRALAVVSHRFWGYPAQQLSLFGITGTNGKTTVAAAVEAMAEKTSRSLGVLGTIDYRFADVQEHAIRTTPEAPVLDRLFAQMVASGLEECVMEVSSHAIALDRVYDLPFTGAVLTNISRDHLDFHESFEDYCETKYRLFTELLKPNGFAIINIDDEAGRQLIEGLTGPTIWRYSLTDAAAELRVRVRDESLSGSDLTFFTPVGVINAHTPLWGAFNFSNLTAAVGIALALGYPPEAIVEGIGDFPGVPGRVQPISSDAGFQVFVDFAHTPDALRQVLTAARPLVNGNMRVLFGCGGDRDRGKRPLMARAVEEIADMVYVTSDNPRREDPMQIIADVLDGFADPDRVVVEPDRQKAIKRIIHDCQPSDSAFLCGKGHETTQLIGTDAIEFDDRVRAEEALRGRGFSVDSQQAGHIG